jgi:hypothetical protein
MGSPTLWGALTIAFLSSRRMLYQHSTTPLYDLTIQFTLEHENNGKRAFLDTIITQKDEKLNIDVYRKPTQTDSYLDYNSRYQHKQLSCSQ